MLICYFLNVFIKYIQLDSHYNILQILHKFVETVFTLYMLNRFSIAHL